MVFNQHNYQTFISLKVLAQKKTHCLLKEWKKEAKLSQKNYLTFYSDKIIFICWLTNDWKRPVSATKDKWLFINQMETLNG